MARAKSPKTKPSTPATRPPKPPTSRHSTAKAAPIGTIGDLFPAGLNDLVKSAKDIAADIGQMSDKELAAMTSAGTQKTKVTTGTQDAIKALIDVVGPLSEGATAEERIATVRELGNILDNIDFRDHQYRMRHLDVIENQQGQTTLKVLATLAVAGLLGAAFLSQKH